MTQPNDDDQYELQPEPQQPAYQYSPPPQQNRYSSAPPQFSAPPAATPSPVFGIISLILGLLGLVGSCLVPIIGFIMVIPAVILGIMAIVKNSGRGMGIAGIITSIIGIILGIIMVAVYVGMNMPQTAGP